MAITDFTLGILLYGNYPDLARRCLLSLPQDSKFLQQQVRVGLNEVCEETKRLVADLGIIQVWEYTKNRLKYPVMREMIHGISPVRTQYFMWFDDDSYLFPGDPLEWFANVERAMQHTDMIGSRYRQGWSDGQREFVKTRDWYRGKDPASRSKLQFITGGWWTIRTELLYRFDYPWSYLEHCGGDCMLGEMFLQQDLRMQQFNYGVAINADALGRESEAKRRGFTQDRLGTGFRKDAMDIFNTATSPPPHP